jgi:MoaA/NifB/PqqE/SkfB family radical SAM enzyme
MDREKAERTVRAGLDRLVVSFDGLSQEAYGAYRIGGDVQKVKEHIQLFNEVKGDLGSARPVIVLQYLINRHNEHELEKIREYARQVGAEFFPTPIMLDITDKAKCEEWLPVNNDLTLNDRRRLIKKKAAPQQSCGFLWNDPVINVDGGLAPCCHLFHKSMDFGNMGEESFSTI